ncbi:NAD(P)/FAD-dependent oxidoreductase [Archangium primigenium]|uniref:NAD(P)/FAD-dependent oxidoreductase n=1 Tax=[Archangium] primigenium TaxID=2792470 RepID=UPI00195656FC|nr:NAD(P)/FAD-dependent oxidoreductase [Archangium primigenium]MBM7114626.1 NAD(P)/FAD-dependent oxidoreductase [Archangium primigenium]
MSYDVVIVGGGPAGLSAALALGRACKRVLLCDAGPRRNAAAEHLHNFVTRDGTPPGEFRAMGREQLAAYPNVEVRDARIEAITGARGAFEVSLPTGKVQARRILLCTGMIDEVLEIEGFRELWGHAIFQCPYCHGWEVRDRRWAYLARGAQFLHFPLQLPGWAREVIVLTGGAFDVPAPLRAQFDAMGIRIETRPVTRLVPNGTRLERIEFSEGEPLVCEVLFAHPPQRHVDVVRALDVRLDENGFVRVDPMTRETSIPGIYAGGDLQTGMQGAIFAAASAVHAAAMLNHELTVERALEPVAD